MFITFSGGVTPPTTNSYPTPTSTRTSTPIQPCHCNPDPNLHPNTNHNPNPNALKAPTNPFENAWQTVMPTLGVAPNTVDIDLTVLHGKAPVGLRYGMRGNCCDACGYRSSTAPDGSKCNVRIGAGLPCTPAACPLMNDEGLPANPFQAQIIAGSCKCAAPQVC
jgi:hypothetical protein